MFIKQVSVFLENSAGRLQSALEIIKDEKINIVSLSLADTSDYGMLRMIVSDSAKARESLKAAGLSAHLTDVLAIKLPHTVGSLQGVLSTLYKEGINVEYMYALSTKDEKACIVIKPESKELCLEKLDGLDLDFVTEEEIEKF